MAKETDYLIGNKTANIITNNSLQDNSQLNSQIEEKLSENTEKDIYPQIKDKKILMS